MTCYHPEKVKHATMEEAREHIRSSSDSSRGMTSLLPVVW